MIILTKPKGVRVKCSDGALGVPTWRGSMGRYVVHGLRWLKTEGRWSDCAKFHTFTEWRVVGERVEEIVTDVGARLKLVVSDLGEIRWDVDTRRYYVYGSEVRPSGALSDARMHCFRSYVEVQA